MRNATDTSRGHTVAEYNITWKIDVEADSPRKAAEYVWREVFNRSYATSVDACVFEVNGERVDLSEPTCTYDDRPVFDGGYFSTPMCEECYGESESDATCHTCGHFPAKVVTGSTGEAFYRCPKCSAQWQ